MSDRLRRAVGSAAVRRCGYALLVVLGVNIVVFFGVAALPGDAATQAAGSASYTRVDDLRIEFGLDKPVWERYLQWWRGVFDGTLGTSLPGQQPVAQLIGEPLVRSLILAGIAALIAVVVGLGAGISAGFRPGSVTDRIISGAALVLISSPEFVVATVAILVFAYQLDWLPAVSLVPVGGNVLSAPQILVLPALCLGLYAAGSMARLVRAAVRVAADSPHVDAAVLAGLPTAAVLGRHVLPSAWGPIAQVGAQVVPYLIGGAVVIERVFGYPGIGSLLVDRIAARDEATVLTVVTLLAAVSVTAYVAADAVVAHYDRRSVGVVS
ncbi:ABC transporter permease [Gordonia sp. N1V]|uniref:ABC transporter permease n=1 Tax=unclassified Gordonia (in: high G+C Gram-positive bacteria) TaxID=2657482 RepID=UPI0009CDE89C|nr:hypothetical protein B1964_19045 [Gordonia sp. i37]